MVGSQEATKPRPRRKSDIGTRDLRHRAIALHPLHVCSRDVRPLAFSSARSLEKTVSLVRPATHYDRAYFNKWYRHPRHRVKSPTDIERQLRFVVAATEYLFERPVRKVLDVGAGEGNWSLALKKIRPGASYYGVDASEYAVQRFGKKRNIRLGTFGQVGSLELPDDFDLVLCCGVLNYIAPRELATGLKALGGLCVGAAYFEVFTSADDAAGDFTRAEARAPAWWRSLFRRNGWSALGMHLYLPTPIEGVAAALERAR